MKLCTRRKSGRLTTLRKLVMCCMLLAAAWHAGALPAQDAGAMQTLPQAQLDVVKVVLAQERAWNNGDLPGFLAGYKHSDDVLFIGGDVTRGFDAMAAHYRKSYPDKATMGTLTFSDLQPAVLTGGSFAVVTGRYQLERSRKAGGPASGIFSLVFEKTADGWKIVLDHTS